MNPNEQSRLIEIMAEVLIEVQGMRQEMQGVRQEMQGMRQEQLETNKQLDRLEKRTEQNTAAIGQLQVSVLRIGDELVKVADLTGRVGRLEDKVFV